MWSSDANKIYDKNKKGKNQPRASLPHFSIFCQKFGEKGDFEAPLMSLYGQYFIGNKLLEDAEQRPVTEKLI